MNIFKAKIFILIFPGLLSAGFFDWFYSPTQATQFECPHECGKWGTESMRKVEWEAVLALWEMDQMGNALSGNGPSYSHAPQSFEDPIFQQFYDKGADLKLSISCDRIMPHRFDRLINNRWGSFALKREISFYADEEGHRGLGFHRYISEMCNGQVMHSFDEFELEEDEESNENTVFFTNFRAIKDFESTLLDDIQIWIVDKNDAMYSAGIEEVTDDIDLLKEYKAQLVKQIEEEKKLNEQNTAWRMKNIIDPLNASIARDEKGIQKGQEERARCIQSKRKNEQTVSTYLPLIESQMERAKKAYCDILDDCIAQHSAPSAYLDRAQYYFQQGLNMNCIADIKKLFEITPDGMLEEHLAAKMQFKQAKAESELALFDDAIETLSSYISKYPCHRKAYLERAIAHFEKGDFSGALKDFSEGGITLDSIGSTWGDQLEFNAGVVKGLTSGIAIGAVEFPPHLIHSLYGVGHGLWAFVTDPAEVSKDVARTCLDAFNFIKENGAQGVFCELFPEAKELVETGHLLSEFAQGEILGRLVGRHGIECFLAFGTCKALKMYRNLKKANAALILQRMSVSEQAQQFLIAQHSEWWEKTAPIINKLKEAKGIGIDKVLLKEFGKGCLSENQVRRVLHHAGFKTFPRPKGIPHDWKVQLSKKGGGMEYIHPTNVHMRVRVMPGKLHSPNSRQQKPYVIQKINGGALDKVGKRVSSDAPEAHISLEEFIYRSHIDGN